MLRLSECIFGTSDSFGNESTLMDFSERQQRSLDIDLVTAGVWIPIATTLMADPAIKMAIFSPGIASILQVSYLNYAILCFIHLQGSWYVGPFFKLTDVLPKYRQILWHLILSSQSLLIDFFHRRLRRKKIRDQ